MEFGVQKQALQKQTVTFIKGTFTLIKTTAIVNVFVYVLRSININQESILHTFGVYLNDNFWTSILFVVQKTKK